MTRNRLARHPVQTFLQYPTVHISPSISDPETLCKINFKHFGCLEQHPRLRFSPGFLKEGFAVGVPRAQCGQLTIFSDNPRD